MKIKLIVAILLVIIGVYGATYYFTQSTPPSPVSTSPTSNTNPTQTEEDAHIVSVGNRQINYVHVDALGLNGAIAAARKEGACPPAMSDNDCIQAIDAGPVYDVSGKIIKTATLATGVTITDYRMKPLTLADIAQSSNGYLASMDPDTGYYGYLFHLTFNNKGEVDKIEGVFRP